MVNHSRVSLLSTVATDPMASKEVEIRIIHHAHRRDFIAQFAILPTWPSPRPRIFYNYRPHRSVFAGHTGLPVSPEIRSETFPGGVNRLLIRGFLLSIRSGRRVL